MSLSSFSLGAGGTSTAQQALAIDARSLNALKARAGTDTPAAAREAAKQFESLFMREMIKSMREATMKSGLLDGASGNLATTLRGTPLMYSVVVISATLPVQPLPALMPNRL